MSSLFYPDNDYRTYLKHGGPGSGRYPLGSGANPFQHVKNAVKGAANDPKTKALFTPSIKAGKDKANVSPAEKITKSSHGILQNTAEVVREVSAMRGRQPSKARSMSDAELRDAINRLRMEAEYDRLTERDTRSGADAALTILGIAGSVVGIVGGVVSIVSTIGGMNIEGMDRKK